MNRTWPQSRIPPWDRTKQDLVPAGHLLLGRSLATNQSVFLKTEQLSTHLHVLGASGVGKSFFLEGLIKSLILQGHGLCLIDPHGDLYHRVLDFCAWLYCKYPKKNIAQRVIPFDIGESKQIAGFNPVARNARVMTYQVVALMEAIRKAWGQGSFQETPRLARWLFNTTYAVIEAELTLVQSKYLLDPKPNQYRDAIIAQLRHPDIKNEWEYIAATSAKERNEFTESSFNRLRPFVMHEVIKLILGRQRQTLDFPAILNDRKILLVNLARQNTISEDYQQMLGTLLINELLTAAFARAQGQRAPFYVVIDEFAQFVTKDICEILDGGRKFGLHLVLAHQHLNQLKQKDPEVYYSTLTNARLKSVFGGLGEEDLDLLSRELFTGELNPEEVKQEIWQTKLRPVETTRLIENYSDSESSGESRGSITHTSLANGEMFIPSTSFFGDPELQSFSNLQGSGSGSTFTDSASFGSSHSETLTPWYEYHEYQELSSRQFRDLEEQLYIKKAQLKRQPNQHHAFLLPDQPVQLLKTGTVIDYGSKITDRQRGEFKEAAFAASKCFAPPEQILKEQQSLEARLLAQAQPVVVSETGTASADNKPQRPRPKPRNPKNKTTIYDSITFASDAEDE